MDDESLGCPTCGISVDERELVTKSLTIENCPKCGTIVRKTEGFSGMHLAAVIAGDVAEIDTWLDNYAQETSQQIAKREVKDDRGFLWAVGTSHQFACECYYDQEKSGFVCLRLVTKDQAESVFEQPDRLTALAARSALQPYGVRHSGWNISDGSSTDAVWGMIQYLDINTLTTTLLTSATDRINAAMQLEATGGEERRERSLTSRMTPPSPPVHSCYASESPRISDIARVSVTSPRLSETTISPFPSRNCR